MNTLGHYKDIKQLNGIIQSFQKKLEDKVNQLFSHILNQSQPINEKTLPTIENKRVVSHAQTKEYSFSRRKQRTNSIVAHSSVINNDLSISQQQTEADHLFQTFKNKTAKNEHLKKSQDNIIRAAGSRSIGGQTYAKPKNIRKKPQILSKEMRWDPFYQKNAIKAQQLNMGMLNLIERGKVGKNIDIITAFEKGRPILAAQQAIFHHAQQKFTDSDNLKKSYIQKFKHHKDEMPRNPENVVEERKFQAKQMDEDSDFKELNSWAITIPEDSRFRQEEKEKKSQRLFVDREGQLYCIQFSHYKLKKDETFYKIKRLSKYYEQWSQFLEVVRQIQKKLQKYSIEIIYCNANRVLELSTKKQSLSKIYTHQIEDCILKSNKKQRVFSIKAIVDKQQKSSYANNLITSTFLYALIRGKYMNILKRKKYEKKVMEWIRNGKLIKEHRKRLEMEKERVLGKFEQQQEKFKGKWPEIQKKKHYQIHIVNRKYMSKFKYFEQFCSTQITRIFNLENNNTNIIYVSPFEINVETINYYFKIMELEEIQNYSDRVTFLELEDITSKIKLPVQLTASQKLYFNSKALRKMSRKVEGAEAYFVINYPTQIDIKLSVFLGIPILSGNFHLINPVRSALFETRLFSETLPATPCLCIDPKLYNVFQFSNVLIRYCQSNKKNKKYVIKINNHHSSSGLALLSYPFNSLHQMYTNTVIVQPYYFKSIQKFFIELVINGGVVQKYEEGNKTVTVCAKILPNQEVNVIGTFEKISNGFVNVGYIFPQKCINHKILMSKCSDFLNKLLQLGHIGYVELTIVVGIGQAVFLDEVQLYSTKITNSLYYFKFLAGGYLNNLGEFLTKVNPEGEQDQNISSLESRTYCYIPFMLHYGLSEKQTSSFFQLCRIGGISFDLESKFGTTFIILGSLKDTIGIITTARDRKNILKLLAKSADFLVKQNSHNISTEMLKQKEEKSKERFSVTSIKEKAQNLI